MRHFKEKLAGDSIVSTKKSRGDLFKLNLAKAEWVDGNQLLPKISFDSSVREELRASWKEALVVKLLGKNIGFLTMKGRLKTL